MRGSTIACSVALCVGLVAGPAQAADPPERVVPAKRNGKQRRADRAARDFSEGGTKGGELEFALASVTTVITAVLIGRGAWELTQIDETRANCLEGGVELACMDTNPARGNRIAAGLSFGFAVPMAVASGWLWARAVRTRRDRNAWRAAHPGVSSIRVEPMVSPRSAGLVLGGRF